ncbi:uncharacterized protein LOC106073803 [Biomphalaria glabrata]|uniref:Uncharacterized protein LOC106073803 n=1 Tax=Biomphalaria glabrata TaxID=6526 RepID=A0A9W3ACC6_BIOGL|nr:uncharacterized protein LOC106073803 [Biomphalaria glabrata]
MGCGGSKNNSVSDGNPSKKQQSTNQKPSPNKHQTQNQQNSPRKDINQNHGPPDHNSTNLNYYDSPHHSNASPRHTKTSQPYPQSKYATTSSYNGSVNEEQHFPQPVDKSYMRRVRAELIKATKGKDIEVLENAMEKFEKNRCEDGGDLTRARERLYFLKKKRDLRDAIRRSNVGVLEKTIKDAKSCRYSHDLQPQIHAAERKLAHLRELNQYSHDILAMDQTTISEIHSYHRPPACVHDVMAASYMLLGHEESTLRDWSYLQAMSGRLGRDSLIHQVQDFDSNNVDDKTAKRVKEILNYHDLGDVRVASNGAATFHVWASKVVDKIEKDRNNEEHERSREDDPESPRRKHEELTSKPNHQTSPAARRR